MNGSTGTGWIPDTTEPTHHVAPGLESSALIGLIVLIIAIVSAYVSRRPNR
jgi:hypothetical protein